MSDPRATPGQPPGNSDGTNPGTRLQVSAKAGGCPGGCSRLELMHYLELTSYYENQVMPKQAHLVCFIHTVIVIRY